MGGAARREQHRDQGRTTWKRGGESIYFRDPDGHLLELATPGWAIYDLSFVIAGLASGLPDCALLVLRKSRRFRAGPVMTTGADGRTS